MPKFKIGEAVLVVPLNLGLSISAKARGADNTKTYKGTIVAYLGHDSGLKATAYRVLVDGVPAGNADDAWIMPEGTLRKLDKPSVELSSWEKVQKITNYTPNKEGIKKPLTTP